VDGPLATLIENGSEDAAILFPWCGVKGKERIVEARERVRKGRVFQTLKDFAVAVGLTGGADGDVMDGVTFDEEGEITKIEWVKKGLNGDLSKFDDLRGRMPRLEVLDLKDNTDLDCDVAKLRLPEGMKKMNFKGCREFAGENSALHNYFGCTSSLLYRSNQLLCINLAQKCFSRTRFLILHSSLYPFCILFPLFAFRFAGDIAQMNLPEGMQSVNFRRCAHLTGTADL
jgi:hypothetical protein